MLKGGNQKIYRCFLAILCVLLATAVSLWSAGAFEISRPEGRQKRMWEVLTMAPAPVGTTR
jgi:hypothetical protein